MYSQTVTISGLSQNVVSAKPKRSLFSKHTHLKHNSLNKEKDYFLKEPFPHDMWFVFSGIVVGKKTPEKPQIFISTMIQEPPRAIHLPCCSDYMTWDNRKAHLV